MFEGEVFPGRMVRTHIWNDVDPARSMVPAGALDGPFGFREYAEYIYDMPPVLLVKNGEAFSVGTLTNAEYFADKAMTNEDIEHVVSMAFPDVRMKTYLEIRMADSLPIEGALAYMALLKGLFYDAENLAAIHDSVAGVGNTDVAAAKAALMAQGGEGLIYGRQAAGWMDELIAMAAARLGPEDLAYFAPITRDCAKGAAV